ncbi:MAG: response regulator [Alphaproteobacteria bacterium]|nr:response regulator [Alphaproteobacteria bacterium]
MPTSPNDYAAFAAPDVREAADVLLAAFVEAPIGLVILTADGTILAVNRTYAEIRGRAPCDLIGQGLETIIGPAGLRAAIADIAHLIRNPHDTRQRDEMIDCADGSFLHCDVMMSVLSVGDRPKLILRQLVPLEAPDTDEDEVENSAADWGTGKVLIVEDNHINRELLTVLMAKDGYEVTGVENGIDAVAAAESGGFDVILMDIQLPRMDGVTATRRIRNFAGRAGAVPIIAVTANALPADRERYRDAGMNDIVGKPIDPDRLSRLVREAIAGRRAKGPEAA